MSSPIQRLHLSALAAALSLSPLPATLAADPGREDPFRRFELPGGARLVVLHLEQAPRQSTFSFLPLGLLLDEPDSAQFSHLIEHLLIRATDPESLTATGMDLNGETTGTTLRLDSYAEPDHWEAALDRHVRWLRLETVEDEVLQREKARIRGEEQATVSRGATHKWAEAAWNQIVRHGRAHAAVHSDVAEASARRVLEYARAHLRAASGVLIASVGPVEPGELRDRLAAGLGALVGGEEPATSALPAGTRREASPSLEATWDLAAHHYLEWAPLPDGNPVDRVAAHALVQIVNMALARDAELGGGRAFARSVAVPEGRLLMLSAAVAEPEAVPRARAALAKALESARNGAGLTLKSAIGQLRAQAGMRIDPEPMRKQLERMGRDATLIEAQLLLNAVNDELQLGLERNAIQEAWKELDVERLEDLIDSLLKREERPSLTLRPAG